ncbi:MAG: hypothetical protein HY235_18285 [Acidobacteria bacterium]|nr:hypothetical protein [Acidobacteriota bacterium]
MAVVIEADRNGALVVPAGVPPGTRYTVAPQGDTLVLRREETEAERWWRQTAPNERAAWLEAWIAALPAGPALPREATRRDSMYD